MTRADVAGALPWIVAAIAVLVTHLLSESRERRKELRAQLDKGVARLMALEERGRRFHMASSFDETEARAIEAEVSSVERFFQRLFPNSQESLSSVVISLKQALTLENFSGQKFVSQELGSSLLTELTVSTVDFEDQLESMYGAMYPNGFPYFRFFGHNFVESAEVCFAFFAGLLIGGVVVYLRVL